MLLRIITFAIGFGLNFFNAAGQSIDSLFLAIRSRGESREMVDELTRVTDSITFIFDNDPSLFAKTAIRIAKERKYVEQLGRAYFAMAGIERVIRNDFSTANHYYDSAISIIKETNDYTTHGRCLLGKALIFMRMAGRDGSRKQFYEAIKMLEKGDERGRNSAREQYIQQLEWDGEIQKALNQWVDLGGYYKKTGHIIDYLFVLDRAIFLKTNLEDTSATTDVEELLEISKKYEFKYLIGQAYFHKGRIQFYQGLYDQALENLLSALAFKKEVSFIIDKPFLVSYIAQCYEALDDIRLATGYWHYACELALLNQTSGTVWVLDQTSDFFVRHGMIDSALHYKNKRIEFIDNQLIKRNLHINELAELYNAREAVATNERLMNDLRYQYMIIWSSVLVCTLLLVITVIIIISRKKIKSRNTQLNESILVRERLISVLAHDVRSPLNNINSLIYLKEYGTTKDEIRSIEEKISTSINSTLNLLNNILLWASSQLSGKKDVVISEVPVAELIDDIYKTFKPIAELKGLTLLIDPTSDIPDFIETDSSIIHLVLRNLVNNAIKFTDSGEVTIKYTRLNAYKVIFEVADTGVGISEEKVRIILGGKNVTKKTLGTNREIGSGLGLMLCQSFLANIGSQLNYEKNLNSSGSVFYFTLSGVGTSIRVTGTSSEFSPVEATGEM